jgi:hypothetical protein
LLLLLQQQAAQQQLGSKQAENTWCRKARISEDDTHYHQQLFRPFLPFYKARRFKEAGVLVCFECFFGCVLAARRPGPPTCFTGCHAPNNYKKIFLSISTSLRILRSIQKSGFYPPS